MQYLDAWNPLSKKIVKYGTMLVCILYFVAFILAAVGGRGADYETCLQAYCIVTENARGCLPIIFFSAFLFEPLYKKYMPNEE